MKIYSLFILSTLLRSAVTYGLIIPVGLQLSMDSTLLYGRMVSGAVSSGALLLWCGFTFGYVCKLKQWIYNGQVSKFIVIPIAILLSCFFDVMFMLFSLGVLAMSLGIIEEFSFRGL